MLCICAHRACRRWDFEKEQNSEKKDKKKLQIPHIICDCADGDLFCGAGSGKRRAAAELQAAEGAKGLSLKKTKFYQ